MKMIKIDKPAHKRVLLDLDGSLCDIDHRLHFLTAKPKNWPAFASGVKDDTLNQDVLDAVYGLYFDGGYEVTIVSGRSIAQKKATQEWLDKHITRDMVYDGPYFRERRDYRADDLVKADIFASIQQLHGLKTEVQYVVFDDRRRVVDYWRSEGLRVFHLAEGDF